MERGKKNRCLEWLFSSLVDRAGPKVLCKLLGCPPEGMERQALTQKPNSRLDAVLNLMGTFRNQRVRSFLLVSTECLLQISLYIDDALAVN